MAGNDKHGLSKWLKQISIPTYVFIAIFAISSWIDINGVWVEIPLLVEALPESWNLPSYLVIIIQIANVGPFAYTIAKKLAPDKVQEWPVIYIIISIGAVACLLLGFLWDKTLMVNGSMHSVALLTLCAFLSLVDCTSSVVSLPYMARFPAQYLTAFYVGEGLSGLIPALIGLGQGVGRDPECVNRSVALESSSNETYTTPSLGYEVVAIYDPPLFSVSTFFFILFGLLCLSGLSFTAVHFLPHCRRQTVDKRIWQSTKNSVSCTPRDDDDQDAEVATRQGPPEASSSGGGGSSAVGGYDTWRPTDDGGGSVDISTTSPKAVAVNAASRDVGKSSPRLDEIESPVQSSTATIVSKESDISASGSEDVPPNETTHAERNTLAFAVLVFLVGWANALTNGVLPSLQSYSCLPYGNLAYNLSVRLSVAVNPLACFVALFVQVRSLLSLGLLTALGTVLAGYQIALASLSPSPPLVDTDAGAALAITSFVLLTAFFSYFKVCAAARLGAEAGANGLLWCGCSTQVGSLIGAIVTFLLVNVFDLFTSRYPCT